MRKSGRRSFGIFAGMALFLLIFGAACTSGGGDDGDELWSGSVKVFNNSSSTIIVDINDDDREIPSSGMEKWDEVPAGSLTVYYKSMEKTKRVEAGDTTSFFIYDDRIE
jgi:hypothetical protein